MNTSDLRIMMNVTERHAFGQIQDSLNKAGLAFEQVTGTVIADGKIVVHHQKGMVTLDVANPVTANKVIGFVCGLDR